MSTEPDTESTPTPDTGAPAGTDSPAFAGEQPPAPPLESAAAQAGDVPLAGDAARVGELPPAAGANAAAAGSSSTPPDSGANAPAASTQPADTPSSRGIDWERHAAAAGRWLIRPRVRLTIAGVALVLIGALWVSDSLWQLVLVVVGLIMVLVAWAGSKLEGHLRIDWGESGTEFEFRTKVHSQSRGLKLSAPSFDTPSAEARPAGTAVATRVEPAPATVTTAAQAATSAPRVDLALVPVDPDVIEGTGRTVEIDLDQLKGLIAAAEAEDAARAARRAG